MSSISKPAQASLQKANAVGTPGQVVRSDQRVDHLDPTPGRATAKKDYIVVVWTTPSCSGCRKYKRTEVPTLLALGYKVEFKDYRFDNPPSDMKVVPTIQLLYKGLVLHSEVYWKARDIDKYVNNRSSLKK